MNYKKMPSNKSFGFIFFCLFLILGGFSIFKGFSQIMTYIFFGFSGLLLIISLIKPNILRLPNLIWFHFGQVLHKITSPLILAVLFFLVFVPCGIILRMFRIDNLHLRRNSSVASYWIKKEQPESIKNSMKNQF